LSNKRERHREIRTLIETQPIASQEELRRHLEGRGWVVTQATLSRDLRELGIVRIPEGEGPRYRFADTLGDDDSPSLEALLPQLFSSVDGVGELLVLHTLPSGAQPIAEAIDAQNWSEVLGTLAGENTVLIICRSNEMRQQLMNRLEELAAG
jgi:transcriptional regulator of arginine metabolism